MLICLDAEPSSIGQFKVHRPDPRDLGAEGRSCDFADAVLHLEQCEADFLGDGQPVFVHVRPNV